MVHRYIYTTWNYHFCSLCLRCDFLQVIPPKEWIPRKAGYDELDIVIPAPIVQEVYGSQGLYTQYNIQKKPIHVKDFEKLANGERLVCHVYL